MHSLAAATAPVVAIIAFAALVTSWAATGLVRRYALARAILDVPNHRSSHTVPTPRGGGAAILLAFLGGVAALGLTRILDLPFVAGIGGGAALIALVGWIDDKRGVPAHYRAMVQVAAAAWALWWLGGLPAISLGAASVPLGIAGAVLAVVAVVWCTNLFNFMDGIDGIAGGQAAASGVVGGALLLAGGRLDLAAIAFIVATSSIGFLFWNWSPAKIFMGDVGSSMLGFVFATLAIAGENTGAVPLVVSLLLGGPFVLDATLTLIRRVARRARWYEAHRSHAYQRAVQSGLSHAQVSTTVVAINLGLGAALLVTRANPVAQLWVVGGGFAALLVAYLLIEQRRPMHEQRPAPHADAVSAS